VSAVQPFSAAIFDFGDTLFHSPSGADVLVDAGLERARAERVWDGIWTASKSADALAKGRDLSEEHHRAGWLELLALAEPDVPGIAPVLYERVIATDRWLPYPDARGVLAALHERGVRIGVLSNIPGTLRPVFERHGLAPFVRVYVESHAHGRVKPDPELFRIACAELDVPAADAVMIGDSHLADGAAVLAGVTAVLLPPALPGTPRGLARLLGLFGGPETRR
jgi:HAD superfamily hydrolase (TIGR01509 family)